MKTITIRQLHAKTGAFVREFALLVMACLGVGGLGSGCSVQSGKTAFFVSMGGGLTSIQLMAAQCHLMSSADTAPSYSPDRLYRCSGSHPVAGGPPVAWVCETPDGRVFDRISLNGRIYYLTNGSVFRLAYEGAVLRIDQEHSDFRLPLR